MVSRRRRAALVTAIGLLVTSCGGSAAGDTSETLESMAAQPSTTPQAIVASTAVTTATTTTTEVTTTTAATTTSLATTTTPTVAEDPTTACADCPDWATEEDRHYVASMRAVESWYSRNFVTSMTALEIIDMGQTQCIGMDGSYNGIIDAGLAATMLLYGVEPGEGGAAAISTIEQAIRVYCPKHVPTWTEWAGTEPIDPFAG